jgi:hypothetical protein
MGHISCRGNFFHFLVTDGARFLHEAKHTCLHKYLLAKGHMQEAGRKNLCYEFVVLLKDANSIECDSYKKIYKQICVGYTERKI